MSPQQVRISEIRYICCNKHWSLKHESKENQDYYKSVQVTPHLFIFAFDETDFIVIL